MPNTTLPVSDRALLIARETVAQMKGADDAHHTAALCRAGKYDDITEVKLVAAGVEAGLQSTADRVVELEAALVEAHAAIAEYYRYWTGGETRGSYDGKPERAGLWNAMHRTRAALKGSSDGK